MAAHPEDVHITSAIRQLQQLRGNVDNFLRFESDVEDAISSLYKKHQTGTKPSEAVLMSRIKLDGLVEPEIKDWIKMIYRRLSSRMRARNPWVIEFRRDLQEVIFVGIKEAVKKGLSSHGVTVTEDNREDTVLFSKKNRLLRDLSLLSGMSRNEILLQFNKVMRGVRKGKAEVTVSEEMPFCIRYCKRKHQVVVQCHFEFTNEFGYTFRN